MTKHLRISCFYFNCFILFLCSGVLLSQESKTIFLKNADNLSGSEKNGEAIRELTGNVELIHGNIRLKCDRAIQYFSSNKVEAAGNVVVYQDTLKLYSDNGVYFANTRTTLSPGAVRITDGHLTLTANTGTYNADLRKADFYGNVKISDPLNTIYSDTMYYLRDSSKVIAISRVKILSNENNSTAFCDSMEYYRKSRHSVLRGLPQLIRIDTTIEKISPDSIRLDTLFLKAKTVVSTKEDMKQLLIATDSVCLLRGSLAIACNDMKYFPNDSTFILKNEPVIWFEENQIFADSVAVFLKNKSLNELRAVRNAFLLSRADSIAKSYNQIMGDTIILYFSGTELDSVISIDKATAFYYLIDSLGINSGYKSAGDIIKITVENKKVGSVKVLYGIESLYYPGKMLTGRQNEYNLPRFKIFEHKPKREDYYKIKK